MKKNEVVNVSENIVMDQETMQAVIEDNMHFVPKNQVKKFQALSLEEQFEKMQYYQDRAAKIEQWKQSASVPNKVKELFEKRHATIDDAKAVIEFCNEYIDNFKQHQIEDIDKQIAALEEKKKTVNLLIYTLR